MAFFKKVKLPTSLTIQLNHDLFFSSGHFYLFLYLSHVNLLTLTTINRKVVIKTISQLLNVVNIFAKTLKSPRELICIVKNVDEVFICGKK